MLELRVERGPVNTDLLDDQLRTILGGQYSGLSTGPGWVIAYIDPNTLVLQQTLARQAIINHNSAQLTPEQSQEEQRQQNLDQLRDTVADVPLLPDLFQDQTVKVLQLAWKVAWLEAEVEDLRARLS